MQLQLTRHIGKDLLDLVIQIINIILDVKVLTFVMDNLHLQG